MSIRQTCKQTLAFLFLAWVLALAPAMAAAVGAVARISGEAFIARPDAPARTVKADDLVNEGDLLTTAKGGEVLIRFNDQSVLTLRPDSSVVVARFQQTESGGGSFLANLLKGALRSVSGLIGKSSPQGVRFSTPTATIGIRGTDFEIAIVPEDTADARAGTYNYVHDGVTTLGLVTPGDGPTSVDVKPDETGLALAHPRPGEPALQILQQRPAFLRGGGLDAHMMQFTTQPMRAIQMMPRH